MLNITTQLSLTLKIANALKKIASLEQNLLSLWQKYTALLKTQYSSKVFEIMPQFLPADQPTAILF